MVSPSLCLHDRRNFSSLIFDAYGDRLTEVPVLWRPGCPRLVACRDRNPKQTRKAVTYQNTRMLHASIYPIRWSHLAFMLQPSTRMVTLVKHVMGYLLAGQIDFEKVCDRSAQSHRTAVAPSGYSSGPFLSPSSSKQFTV